MLSTVVILPIELKDQITQAKAICMQHFVSTTLALFLFVSCAQTQNSPSKKQGQVLKIPAGDTQKPAGKEAVATFAEGCFWHTEIVFQSLEGVRDAVSGYAGGNSDNPDYENVGHHAESVNVYYDPSKISFQTLVKAFFASHDPTQTDGQGNDLGSQYRSIAFYRNNQEKGIIEQEMKSLSDSKKYSSKIVTEEKPLTGFYPAEAYHQEYVLHHPDEPYVRNVSIRDYERFRREFKEGKFKQ
jgi:peptide-methionine (S)-S-oxide reductase